MAKFAEISNPRTGIAILSVNKENPLACICINSKNEADSINTTALLMPIQIR